MNTMPAPADVAPAGSYEATRFNALQHGVLSRYAVLPWEDRSEYEALLDALVAEHVPAGPTEEHLVEELAGIIWRNRRLRMAEAAVFREKLRHDATAYNGSDHVAGAALLPVMGDANGKANISQAMAATPADTARDLRDVKRDQSMTQRAWNILEAGGPDAYQRALRTSLVNMPETSMHEDHNSQAREHKIGAPRKVSPVQPIAESHRMGSSPDGELRLGVAATHSGHHPAAYFGGNDVHAHTIPDNRSPGSCGRRAWSRCRLRQSAR